MHNKTLYQFQFLSLVSFLVNFSLFSRKASSAPTWAWSVQAIGQIKTFHFRKYFQVGINLYFTFQSPQLFPKYALFLASFGLIWENQKRGNWSVGVDLIRTNSQLDIVLFVVIISDLFVHVGAFEASLPQSLELQVFVTEPLKGISLLRAP